MNPLQQTVTRHGRSGRFAIISGDQLKATPDLVARIVACCNEREIYASLFTQACNGLPYNSAHALQWLDWVRDGWAKQTHFCFFVLDEVSLPVASCDLKTSDVHNCEIGYWCSRSARGVMTNAVMAMLRHASLSGFESFHAFVRPANMHSQRLLDRIGFFRDVQRDEPDRLYYFSSARSLIPPVCV
jgi:RimJ/RimL family protein N-acetyltransferase